MTSVCIYTHILYTYIAPTVLVLLPDAYRKKKIMWRTVCSFMVKRSFGVKIHFWQTFKKITIGIWYACTAVHYPNSILLL